MRISLLRALSITLFFAACSDPIAPPDDASMAIDAAPDDDAGVHDGGAQDGGALDGGAPLPVLPAPWRRESSLALGADHHTTVIVESPAGAYLYALGGMRSDTAGRPVEIYDTVRRARIGEDGALGAWEDESPFPAPLAFQAVATRGRTIVLAGGVSPDGATLGWIPFVMQATVDDEGHVGRWNGVTLLEEPTLHAAAVVVGERFYLVGGGAGAASSSATVVSVRIGVELPEDLRIETALPAPRSHHVLLERDGFLYVAGGFEGPPTPAHAILRAPLDALGVVGAWEMVGTMAEPMWTAGVARTADAMILVGGGIGGAPTDRIVRLPFDGDGQVGAAEDFLTLPYPRAHVHQTPTHGGRLYSAGGRYAEGFGQASSADVYSVEIAGLL